MNTTFIEEKSAVATGGVANVSMDCSLLENQSPPNFVTQRQGKSSKDQENNIDSKLTAMQDTLMLAIEGWFTKQQAVFNKEFTDVKQSLQYFNGKLEDICAKSLESENRIAAVEEKIKIIDTQNYRINELEAKIDSIEQQARQCNVEISNLPEKLSENLVNIVTNIGAYIKLAVTTNDIVAVHRVPQAKKESSQPKNVIVKFATRTIKDNFLAAARRARGLTSEQINISGTPRVIYINEHLTLKKKILFRETRIAAKEHGFRFVWSKNGNVLVRQKETSPVFSIRNVEEISLKMKQQKNLSA